MKPKICAFFFSLIAINLIDQPAPEVTIAQGILSGKISEDGTYFEYLGIPYATAGRNRRFQAALPPPSWKGVFKATDENHSCLQKFPVLGYKGSEDCLKINVYVPSMAKKPVPVMVYIHGGAFILGSGGKLLYGPDFLVQHDIILVTFNYRLGPFGFMCLGIKDAPGNAGLKDQIAALRWVKNNIAAFGGDPDNVTIFGESAGAASTSLLLASKATEGLFKGAIVQSGSGLSNWALNRKPLETAILIAKELGYNTTNPHELYDIFLEASVEDLLMAKPLKPPGLFFESQLLHLPCVEKPIPGVEAALTDLPYNLIQSNPKNIPVIYGSTSKEGFFLVYVEANKTVIEDRNGRYLFDSDVEFVSEAEAREVNQKLHRYYFGDDRISMEKVANVTDLYTHLFFEMPMTLETEMLIQNGNTKVYNYYFNYSGGRNFLKKLTGHEKDSGACHGDEILYLFKGKIHPYRISSQDQQMIRKMTKMWTDFAKHGDPTPGDSLIKWSPSTKDELKYLYIDQAMSMGPIPNPEEFKIWKSLYTKYRRMSF